MALRIFDAPPAPNEFATGPASTPATDTPIATEAPTETPAAEPVVEPTAEAEPVETDDQKIQRAFEQATKLAEESFHEEVRRAQEAHAEAAIYRDECQDRLKSAKQDEKDALERMVKLKKRGPQYPDRDKFFADQKAASAPQTETVTVFGQTIETQLAPARTIDENAWRSYPTAKLIDGIEGMGKKKAEALIELAPTLGQLEDLRGEASKQHLGNFSKVLPKGFGESIAQKLEDAMLLAMQKVQSESPVPSVETKPEVAETKPAEVETEPVVSETASVETESKSQENETVPAESETPAELIPINERFDQIASSKDYKCKKNQDAWQDGYETGLDELPVEKCPFKTQAEVDDWLRGWCQGESEIL